MLAKILTVLFALMFLYSAFALVMMQRSANRAMHHVRSAARCADFMPLPAAARGSAVRHAVLQNSDFSGAPNAAMPHGECRMPRKRLRPTPMM